MVTVFPGLSNNLLTNFSSRYRYVGKIVSDLLPVVGMNHLARAGISIMATIRDANKDAVTVNAMPSINRAAIP